MSPSTVLLMSACLLGALPLMPADRIALGLTAGRAPIHALSVPGRSPDVPAVLVIGGLDGGEASARAVSEALRKFESSRQSRRRFRLLAIPMANPEKARLVFPPAGPAYRENGESHYLWRWIALQAPDLVLIAGPDEHGLGEALSREAAAGIGRIPAQRVDAKRGILGSIPDKIARSEAGLEMDRRLARTPRQVADLLSRRYGHELKDAVYIPAVALIGRLRLGHLEDVQRIVAPFLDGSRDSLAKPTGSHLAGHLVFGELAGRTGGARYVERVRAAADLGFTASGEMKESMPLHSEMSDAVFMGCPILAKAGKLTGESRYHSMALRHLQFIRKLCLRPDGLYRHSPLDETAWGRGNAFPALGLALTLSDLPAENAAFQQVLLAFQNHLAALARHQTGDGMWRQVIDRAGSYPEFSATAMIAAAMLRGVRAGWLDRESYQPRIESAWRALNRRIADGGTLIDVCESTGKQKSIEDYLNRIAILDRDPRGGAMALLIATEMANLQ